MSQPSLKLTMIGTSGTGKSCYLYATYYRMLEGVAGFNFSCNDFNQARELASAWDVILDDGVWPPGTAESEEYRFSCVKDGDPIGEFTWLDYRGGVLNETGGSQKEVDEFLLRVRSSDAILACMPADAILATRNGGKLQNQWLRIKIGILGALAAIYQTTSAPSLIFLVTKSDLCKSPEDERYCVETVRASFGQYFKGKPKYAMIASTRMGRFDDERGDFQQGEPIGGVVDPTNVHLPILFPFWQRAKETQDEGLAEAQADCDAAEQARDEAQAAMEDARVKQEKAEGELNAVKRRVRRCFLTLFLILFSWGAAFLMYYDIIGEAVAMWNNVALAPSVVLIIILAMALFSLERIASEELKKNSAAFKQASETAAIKEEVYATFRDALEEAEAVSAETSALVDAIWREFDGRVDLYEDGTPILSAGEAPLTLRKNA